MGNELTEILVRQWLRDHPGQVHCAGCLAETLGRARPHGTISVAEILVAMEELAHEPQVFWSGPCLCGGIGLRYGW
jgi:hypothetical protein